LKQNAELSMTGKENSKARKITIRISKY